jgi:cell division protease FtsH
MDEFSTDDQKQPNEVRPVRRMSSGMWLLLMLAAGLILAALLSQGGDVSDISYKYALDQIDKGNVAKLTISGYVIRGMFNEPPMPVKEFDDQGKVKDQPVDAKGNVLPLKKFFRLYVTTDQDIANLSKAAIDKQVDVKYAQPGDSFAAIIWVLFLLLPLGLLAMFWFSMRRARNDITGAGFLSGFSRSPAKRYEGVKQPVMFKDVAGLEGVKADLAEIVDFLKSPEKFQKLGGRIPKGVLLNGPPGTGKTLLARAVAGEAGVPFFSVSGSEFIQMFVGVGASRVRDLFRAAKEVAPAIIFIDEIDAVGRQRGAGLGGGHDEREQTLNQILSEMDGFAQTDSVIVLAATNRVDVLDPALLRPGRFDRHIMVGRPTQKGRVEIFKVHVRDVPLADDVDLERIASGTVGLTGADIRNIVNEAALWAARNNKNKVDMSDFDYARDKILMGAKREEVLSPKEKEKTAYHEAGHTLLALESAWERIGCIRSRSFRAGVRSA